MGRSTSVPLVIKRFEPSDPLAPSSTLLSGPPSWIPPAEYQQDNLRKPMHPSSGVVVDSEGPTSLRRNVGRRLPRIARSNSERMLPVRLMHSPSPASCSLSSAPGAQHRELLYVGRAGPDELRGQLHGCIQHHVSGPIFTQGRTNLYHATA